MTIKHINPAALYDGAASGMSQATLDTDSGLVFVSGQVDWNSEHRANHPGIAAQTESAAKNLITVLEAAGSSVEHLLQLRVYIRGEISEHLDKVVPVLVKYLGVSRPALTGIGVTSLASPDLLIEIEAVAKVAK
ncbi:RidA family protein [Janthinobacterium agaricidamnosum]|uniref:Endoribonuclease L-PSP family protein n=1 Tax=Janthinobacterium agaricidamnosum NBRC 102515 = DSM 9628 TaxID=1349767 RepID=W0UX55_9BURK|nr:RidA family protein [Janthinobacterium agaricidamnosum]CDG81104.1 endoribonuclease L-PSP family protein [Janthinobacterium agaricidamnosum NBRC 102515 = DSM 9628]